VLIALQQDDVAFRVEVEQINTVKSKHTSRDLMLLSVRFQTRDENEKAKSDSRIAQGKSFVTRGEGGVEGKSFKIHSTRFSYVVDDPLVTHSWELEEVETLAPSKLTLGDLEVVPYKYRETIKAIGTSGEGILDIIARVALSPEQEAQLHNLPLYFNVVRWGVNSEPKEMRFGQVMWSQEESG